MRKAQQGVTPDPCGLSWLMPSPRAGFKGMATWWSAAHTPDALMLVGHTGRVAGPLMMM